MGLAAFQVCNPMTMQGAAAVAAPYSFHGTNDNRPHLRLASKLVDSLDVQGGAQGREREMKRLLCIAALTYCFIGYAREETGRSSPEEYLHMNNDSTAQILLTFTQVFFDDGAQGVEIMYIPVMGDVWDDCVHVGFANDSSDNLFLGSCIPAGEPWLVIAPVPVYTRFGVGWQAPTGGNSTHFWPLVEPTGCGPIHINYTVKNEGRFEEVYGVYKGGVWLESFEVGRHNSYTYTYDSEEECETITIYKMIDKLHPFEEEASFDPEAPLPPPEVVPPPEPPEPQERPLPYEDTEYGPIEDDDEKDDGRKTREVIYNQTEMIAELIEGDGDDTMPEGTGDGEDVEFSGNSSDVLALGELMPEMPSITSPGTQTSFSCVISIPHLSSVHLSFDLTKYSVPIAIFRGIMSAALTLTFFFVVVRTIREAFA